LPPLNILIIPDKFKGTISAGLASQAIARGWRSARPRDRLNLLPMSDGGDGFGAVMSQLMVARQRRIKTTDAAHHPCLVPYWWQSQSHTAIIETSRCIGLAMLPANRFHPFELDTSVLARLFRAAAKAAARRCLVGIGGSATNDGGFGLAKSMGWEFLDQAGHSFERWIQVHRLAGICTPHAKRRLQQIIVAVDVQNPLFGQRGATRIYGPQKGLGSADFPLAESCLKRLARVWKKDFGGDLACDAGAGAAGGLGFGLRAFLGADLQRGFDLFAEYADLDRRLQSVDLVITGEGAIDESTLMGKGVGQIARRCKKLKIPCIGLGGIVKRCRGMQMFSQTHSLTGMTTEKEAKTHTARWLAKLATQVAAEI